MADIFKQIDNPLEIARPFAEQVGFSNVFEVSPKEEALLVQLDEISTAGKADGTYFVETFRAMSIPASFDKDREVEFHNFFGLSFEGPFRTFSIVGVGRIIGASSVRALCLSFGEARLLPYFDTLPDDHILHVPVLAVESMSRTS